MKSSGEKHGKAVKRGIHRYQENISDLEWSEIFAKARHTSFNVSMVAGLCRLLNKLALPIPTPDELERELRLAYQRGYIQALRDVRRERENQEAAKYQEAFPTISYQELKRISHVYDTETK